MHTEATSCFAHGQLVYAVDADKLLKEIPIEKIRVNDTILSFDEAKGVAVLDKVILVNNHEGYRGTCVNVEMQCGDKTLELERNHLTLIRDTGGSLIKKVAQDVCVGDQMMLLGRQLNASGMREDSLLELLFTFEEVKTVR